MKKFIEAYRLFKNLKSIDIHFKSIKEYRFCWINTSNGNGLWAGIVFSDDELERINKNIWEIYVY